MKNIILMISFSFVCESFANPTENSIVSDSSKLLTVKEKPTTKHWYETVSLKGYAQVRYNRLGESNPNLKCAQCDGYWGNNNGISFRRARLTFSGQLSPRVYFYFQNDIAQTASSGPNSSAMQSTGSLLNFTQIRDAYFDVNLNKSASYRIRIGQSKVPFGFDNLQSSQIRLAFDRSDAINSGAYNERDLGAFFMWAPTAKRELFSKLVKDNLKGSGDYGVLALGVYNGQTANRPELNNNLHSVIRFSWPFQIKNQIIETGVQGYTGIYTYSKDLLSTGVKYIKKPTYNNEIFPDASYQDERIGAHFVLFPKPFGIQSEWNQGKGPRYNPTTDSIETSSLSGGYVTLSYKTNIKNTSFIPYYRYQTYRRKKE